MESNGYKIKPHANLTGANLDATDLTFANLKYANLKGANLRGANLTGADLQGAYLLDIDLERAEMFANLTDAILPDGNIWREF